MSLCLCGDLRCVGRGLRGDGSSQLTETSFETPGSCMVTPYSTDAISIVRRLCVTTMNCASAAHLRDHFGEAPDIGFVQRRVDFVQDAEGTWLVAEDGDEQRQRRQSLSRRRKAAARFAAACLAAARRCRCPRSPALSGFGQAHLPVPPPKSVWKAVAKWALITERLPRIFAWRPGRVR